VAICVKYDYHSSSFRVMLNFGGSCSSASCAISEKVTVSAPVPVPAMKPVVAEPSVPAPIAAGPVFNFYLANH